MCLNSFAKQQMRRPLQILYFQNIFFNFQTSDITIKSEEDDKDLYIVDIQIKKPDPEEFVQVYQQMDVQR